jgi:hypothetical protein
MREYPAESRVDGKDENANEDQDLERQEQSYRNEHMKSITNSPGVSQLIEVVSISKSSRFRGDASVVRADFPSDPSDECGHQRN